MDNYWSFRRFTNVDPNISRAGATVEEFRIQRGNPDPNPVLSPMADQAVSDVRLALTRAGSDRMRLAEPAYPEANPYDGPKRVLVLSRNAVKKLMGSVLRDLERLVQDVNRRSSLARVSAMRELLETRNRWAGEV